MISFRAKVKTLERSLNMITSLEPYKLSVVMIVKNEAKNLLISLPALKGLADEIIILDSGSSDESEQIAKQHNAKWLVNTNWQGFGKQRQIAQSYASGDWILALDADEEVTPELKRSILEVIKHKPANIVYGIKRLDCIFGHQIDNPYWAVKAHWRLYPSLFQYNDNPVHESVQLAGAQTKTLTGFLLHHTADTPEFWLRKRLNYAMTWANDRHKRNKHISAFGVLTHFFWSFIKQYLIDGRFIQGRYGFLYSCLFTQYTFNKYSLLYDLNKQPESYDSNFQPHAITYQNLPDLPNKVIGKKRSLSVVMIVKNEQKHLPACLSNVYDIADEIILLDSGSTDQTHKIAKHFGAKWFVNTEWKGFGKQRQLAQKYATGDYVLMIDADEQLDEDLKQSIIDVCQRPLVTDHAFALKRINIFCGKRVHPKNWYADRIARLYANDNFQYSNLEVHESLDCDMSKAEVLKGSLLHFTNDNLYHFLDKNIRYSHDWATEKKSAQKRTPSIISLPFRSFFSFFREYIIRLAIAGKAYGLFLSSAAAGYNFNKYLMLSVKHKKIKTSEIRLNQCTK